jgi:alkylation response protein AidB-like acyl-CoA dehydrogenase
MSEQANREKDNAMDLAEDSRQKEWHHPSFVAELFRGDFRWDLISPFPVQSEEDKRLGDEFIEKLKPVLEQYIDPNEVDRTEEVPQEALLALAELGCFGLTIAPEYGGLGFSKVNYNRIMAYIGSYCASTAVWLSAHQSIGVPQPLKVFGTKEQKEKYLPRLAKGAVSAFALTEPDVGSDPAKMITTATPSEDGSYYLINGEKLWITNGPAAELLVVMAKTPSIMVKGKEKAQITAFVVESDTPGYEVAHHCSFMGIRGISNGLLRFTNMKVPAENVIGKTGEGLKIALTTLNTGRMTIPATSLAGGKAAMHFSLDWVNTRVQWGAPVGKHQSVGIRLANMSADTLAMDAINWLTCAFVDRGGVDIRLEAAMAKYFCTEVGWRIADDFLQVRGGSGYETAKSLGRRGKPPIPTERAMRDARISRIIEGTSEIMQLFIAREAMDTHMKRVMPIMMGKGPKGKAIMEAIKFYVKWYPKTWLPARYAESKHLSATNQDHLAYIGRTAKRLARSMFHTMAKYGAKLEYEQLILNTYVNIGTDLFTMAASLSRAEALLAEDPKNEELQDLTDLYCRNARARISDAFRSVKHNHNRLVNKVRDHYMEGKYEWLTDGVYKDLPEPDHVPSSTPPDDQAKADAPQTEVVK